MARKRFGDVAIILPGITGSVLQRDGKDIWAVSPGAAFQALISLGKSIKHLTLKGDDVDDGITATRLIQDVHLIPNFWEIDGYTKIKKSLLDNLTLDEGKNLFEFPYDWRRDNRLAARQLAEQAPRWLHDWRTKSGNENAKLVLITHSMGGLVARYYLEVLGGWQDTRHLISFGTPYRGSLNAVDFLVHGMKKGVGPVTIDLTPMLRSFTSVYQLLPIYPCVDGGSGLVRVSELSLPGVDRARAQAALEFHREIESAVTKNRDDDAFVRAGYGIHPVVGIFQPTRQSVRVRGKKVEALTSYDGSDEGGDGTVPRVSATPIEMSDDPREVYVTDRHASIQNADAVLSHLTGALTRKRLGTYRDTPFNGFLLDAPGLVRSDMPLPVSAATQGPVRTAVVTATNVDTGRTVRRRTVRRRRDGSFGAELAPMPAGIYRLRVAQADGDAVAPTTDLVTVLDPR
jgi:pimeloyl-ACP methyl ester carboxylesterase